MYIQYTYEPSYTSCKKLMMKFRYDIALLRVIAILSVVFYHFKFPFFHAGFVGVDIFFVLSGYLMTKIIYSEILQNKFNLINFYKKRLIRIFPPLLTMITIFGILLYVILPIKLFDYALTSTSSILFSSNIYFYLKNNYFDALSQENFLLHTWSLSLEWQFYLIYPIIILVWNRFFKKKSGLILTILLSSISLILMIYFHIVNKSFAFYMFPTRAWEMTMGGIVFFLEDKIKVTTKFRNIVSIISLTLLVLTILNIIEITSQDWPSIFTLIPALASAVLIAFNPQSNFLRNKIIKFIAEMSYSWYLWHWPIYVLAINFIPNYHIKEKLLLVIITFSISLFFYYLIERKKTFNNSKTILAYTITLALFSYIIPKIEQKNKQFSFYHRYKKEILPRQFSLSNGHLTYDNKHFIDTSAYLNKIENRKNYLLIGDSHTGMFSDYLVKSANAKNINLIQISADATFPEKNTTSDYQKPEELMNWIFDRFIPYNYQKIDKVILSADYSSYTEEQLKNKIKSNNDYFEKYDITYVYIGQTPKYIIDYPLVEYLNMKYNIGPEKYYDTKSKTNNSFLKKILNDKYIDILSLQVKTNNDSNFYIFDKNHLSEFGANQYAKKIEKQLFNTDSLTKLTSSNQPFLKLL